ncbi:MAG TPA: iron donor protein CyaY, partial [bacterium]|nr:iron donor protein CyaY [bacterium]
LVQSVYDRVLKAMDRVDPDVAEAELSQGTLSINLAGGSRWILSAQPPVRQLWLAVASRGRAFHFDYDAASQTWQDDKGEGLELLTYLERLLAEEAGLSVHL